MHISDGVLTTEVLVGSGLAAAGAAGGLLWRLNAERIPRIALCTAFFFVASLVHVPIGPTSVHLLLIGLVGIIVGPWAFLPILFGVVLQALLFQHGGITTIGANALIMGLPAYAAWGVYRAGRPLRFRGRAWVFGFLAAWLAVELAAVLLGALLLTAGEYFRGGALTALVAHQPVAVVEGIVTGFAAALIHKVDPAMLEDVDE